MNPNHPNGLEPAESVPAPWVTLEQTLSDADQTASDADQTGSDADQSAADRDQHASATDERSTEADDAASSADQRTADAEHATKDPDDAVANAAYEASKLSRETSSAAREIATTNRARAATSRDRRGHDRDETAATRDATSVDRDVSALARDKQIRDIAATLVAVDPSLARAFEELRLEAATDRAQAGRERDKATRDRADAVLERARFEAELGLAHRDALTGAYGREMGLLALEDEIARARRADGRFVLAFLDVDDLKLINDRHGHRAGDLALQSVATSLRDGLRSYDPIVRFGGDEFVCGIGGTSVGEAEGRFATIARTVKDRAGVGISLGLAPLGPGDSLAQLIARADEALLAAKRERREPGWRAARGSVAASFYPASI